MKYLIFDIHTQHTSIFNECHIHSCDCTWLNVFSHALSLVIYHKKIFEFFSCFWKVLCFCKNCQKFQKIFCTILATQSRVEPVACPSRESIKEIFRDSTSDSLAGKCFSREKDLEYFSKFGFSCFSRLKLATWSRVEGPIARGTQSFSRLSSRLSHEWNFQSRKTLRKFSKVFFLVFWRLVLATCTRLVSVAKIACFGQT